MNKLIYILIIVSCFVSCDINCKKGGGVNASTKEYENLMKKDIYTCNDNLNKIDFHIDRGNLDYHFGRGNLIVISYDSEIIYKGVYNRVITIKNCESYEYKSLYFYLLDHEEKIAYRWMSCIKDNYSLYNKKHMNVSLREDGTFKVSNW